MGQFRASDNAAHLRLAGDARLAIATA